jgi:hypothetical protein
MATDKKDEQSNQRLLEQDKPEEEEQAVVAYYYLPEENANNASYPGVPLGDILQHTYDAQPEWIQKSIAASPMYKAADEPKKKATGEATKPGKAEESEK